MGAQFVPSGGTPTERKGKKGKWINDKKGERNAIGRRLKGQSIKYCDGAALFVL